MALRRGPQPWLDELPREYVARLPEWVHGCASGGDTQPGLWVLVGKFLSQFKAGHRSAVRLK